MPDKSDKNEKHDEKPPVQTKAEIEAAKNHDPDLTPPMIDPNEEEDRDLQGGGVFEVSAKGKRTRIE